MSLGNDQKLSVKLIKEWADGEKHEQDLRPDSEEANTYEADDDSKIKPEIELKETTDDFVYKADFRGHLQLVNTANVGNNHCRGVEVNQAGKELTKMSSVEVVYNSPRKQDLFSKKDDDKMNVEDCNRYEQSGEQEQWSTMKSILPNSEDVQEIIVTWEEPLQHSDNNLMYAHVKNMSKESVEDYYVKEEPPENLSQQCNFGQSLPEIYDYSSEIEISDSSWEQPFAESSQLHKNVMRNKNMILLTQAEKKRLYRMRIKEENPAMWSNIKKREAARKREQREKRRHILFEMQRAMECADMPDSPDVMNHKLYLEALKERYPELWNQLINALPATQDRNEQLYNERKSKSRRLMPKPAKMYKDVIEAQKKRLYRQRIKEERPEMYARQKARDAYARSVQRLMLKKKGAAKKNGINVER
ncbi:uncharacterized protein LOC118197128 isoform X2 [Stegodyphus dumicola]|uniref:uncharacterized protein LOC118197128 isoform X2 n=1 Tax=Stegodyphus dumicola TaxID=202533 RepID=UPI0015ABBFC8|nr:uncharacterized protein LOC118197128 isoform X2 [Stegodyphus dumicola]